MIGTCQAQLRGSDVSIGIAEAEWHLHIEANVPGVELVVGKVGPGVAGIDRIDRRSIERSSDGINVVIGSKPEIGTHVVLLVQYVHLPGLDILSEHEQFGPIGECFIDGHTIVRLIGCDGGCIRRHDSFAILDGQTEQASELALGFLHIGKRV